MTRSTTRLAAVLLTGFFLVQGAGASVAPAASARQDAIPAGTVGASADVVRPGDGAMDAAGGTSDGHTGRVPGPCGGEHPSCSMDPADAPPPPCMAMTACGAAAFVPAGTRGLPAAAPDVRGPTRPSLRVPGSVFLERHTPPPRV